MISIIKKSTHINLFVFFLLSAFWLFFCYTSGTITSGYHFMDDHLIVSMKDMLNGHSIYNVCDYYINVYESYTRFRPAFWIIKVLECEILGMNIYFHSIYLCILGGFTSYLLFLFGKNIGFSQIESILFALLILLGEQSEIWWMTGAAENRGMFFLSLSLYIYSISYRKKEDNIYRKIFFVLFIIISSLCKESFILLIPSVIFLRIILQLLIQKYTFKSIIRNESVIAFLLLILMFSELFYIYIRGTDFGYAGVDSSATIYIYLQTLETFFEKNFLGSMILLSILFSIILSIYFKKFEKINADEGIIDWYLILIIFITLSIIPQIFLYAKSGLNGRYMIPISISYSFLLVAPISNLRLSLNKVNYVKYFFYILLIIPSIVIVYKNYIEAKKSANIFTNRAYENAILISLDKYAINSAYYPILIVIDPTQIPTLENQVALNVYIEKYLKKSNPIYYDLLSNTEPNNLTRFEADIYKSILTQNKDRDIRKISDKTRIKTILILNGLETIFLKKSNLWFDIKCFKIEKFNNYTIFHKKL